MRENEERTHRGISANAIMTPLGIVLTVLLVSIIVLVFEVNRSSNKLTDLMERFGIYQQEATNLQAGINTLSETASNYAQMPVGEDGSPSVGPLMAFAEELKRDRRGPDIAERFRGYDVSEEMRGLIEESAETSVVMMDIQTHVISLLRSVYPLPPIPELSNLPEIPLTDEELAMPEAQRVGYAKKMILGSDYAQMKHSIAENTIECNHLLQENFSRTAAETRRHVAILRSMLWAVIICIAVILILCFVVLRAWVVWPLQRHAEEIVSDEEMKPMSGFKEMQVLVSAYNGLLDRRNKLEEILRSAAETDALTGLPNRFSFEQYALESGDDGRPLAVMMFDVNYLKQTNDARGHLAGDKLLRTAGQCICECFAEESGDNCYRLGGDEFAAVLRESDEKDIKGRVDRFAHALERERISVSVGYAIAKETKDGTFKRLLGVADRRMYENKKQLHEATEEIPQ